MRNYLIGRRWIAIALMTAFVLGGIMAEDTFAQLAKIHRKTAQLTVQPVVIYEGHAVSATVQPFTDESLRVCLVKPSGDVLAQESVQGDGISTVKIQAPEGIHGSLVVVLEAMRDGVWNPVAEQDIVLIPDFLQKVNDLVREAEAIEQKAFRTKGKLLHSAWAVLAFAEDLLERLKMAGTDQINDLGNRLEVLRTKVELLKNKKDPLDNSPGYQLRGYRSNITGDIQLYSLYVPKNYEPGKPWPLVVMLHGAWSNHHLALRRVLGHPNDRGEDDVAAKLTMPSLPDVPYLAVAPNGFETMSYRGFAEDDVWRVIDEVMLVFNVDPNRLYLTGLSMGGYGTGRLGLRNPSRFAAIAPVCGFFSSFAWADPEKMPEFQRRFEEMSSNYALAENALHLPVKLMHGDVDPVVPPKESQALYDRLKELGYNVSLEMYPGIDHAAWVPAYENVRIFDWFSQFKRDPAPKKVIFKTGHPYGGNSYWIGILPEKIHYFARVEASVAENEISIQTENAGRLTLAIPTELVAADQRVRVVIDDKAVYEGVVAGKNKTFQQTDDSWEETDAELPFKLRPGMRGVETVFEDRHVYAYGTDGTEENTTRGQDLAVAKSIPGNICDVRWTVLPEDRLSNEVCANNNVVLFSTVEGSVFLKKYINELPIELNDGKLQLNGREIKPDQGIMFIYPNPVNPDRYILVLTSATVKGLQSFNNYVSDKWPLGEESYGDFIIFDKDGSRAWGGLFDKDWNVEATGDF